MLKQARTLTPGTVLSIELADGSFGFGELVEPPFVTFYGIRGTEPMQSVESIISSPQLFTIAVHDEVVASSKVVGSRDLGSQPQRHIFQFVQDLFDPEVCMIFDNLGNERAATPEECIGLERSAVWELRHVRQRLLDELEGRPNTERESQRVVLSRKR